MLKCADGLWSLAGSTECQTCPLGFYCPSGISLPQPCPGGKYRSAFSELTCKPCPGSYSCEDSGIAPIPCTAGKYDCLFEPPLNVNIPSV